MAKHALLSASGAHRWLLCTPSAQLEQKFPASTSAYAEEGTVAHALAELTTRYFLGELDEVSYENQIKSEFEPNSYYNAEMRECAVAYPITYKTGNIRKYGSQLYRCLQDHTSQADWTPDVASSLWKATADPAEEWPAWSQPQGAHDAYAKGAKVSHSDKHWTSNVDNNVWEPGVYGWTEVAE